ncbi:MAG: hypothetical protein AAGJ46_20185 [Planctomycetota bacterium]
MNVEIKPFVENAIAHGEHEKDGSFHIGGPDWARSHLVAFNRSIDALVYEYGKEPIGKAIWYLYGCVGDYARDAIETAPASECMEFYQSLETLYDEGFAKHCVDACGHSDRDGNRFGTACYMLWDMNGGLEYLTFNSRAELFSHGKELVEFGLQHNHAAVQESFLHLLGHLTNDRPDYATECIDRFLQRIDVALDIQDYARSCRTGLIP